MYSAPWSAGLVVGAILLAACGPEGLSQVPGADAAPDSRPPGSLGDVPDGGARDAAACDPPDLLVVLDRSASMGKPIGKGDAGTSPTKMTLASRALTKLIASPTDATLRFGLEVFPDVAGACGSGSLLVPPALGKGVAIAQALAKLDLLSGTPIGGPLEVARAHLAAVRSPGRKQFVLLVTDGGETCAAVAALPAVQRLAAEGVQTFVVGFGGAVDEKELNDLACAGGTAPNLAASCTTTAAGRVWKGTGANLFFSAQDEKSLESALDNIAGTECCGCTVK